MVKTKFGVFLPFYSFMREPKQYYANLKRAVLECERLGYDSVWLDDHLMYHQWPVYETWSTLSALAAQTSRIRLGTMVSCLPHRHPALLAKTAATFDVLSDGRLEFGIGAGVDKYEHEAYGFTYPKYSVRVEQLGEAVEVIKRLWTQSEASFKGKHFCLNKAFCEPKPQQKPHPPIVIGGSGDRLPNRKDYLLKVTAKHADRYDWGFIPTMDMFKCKLLTLEQICQKVGRDFAEVEKSCWPGGQVLIANSKSEVLEKINQHKATPTSVEEYKRAVLAGTPEECIERLHLYLDLGVTYFMLFFADLPSTGGLQLFAEEVIGPLS